LARELERGKQKGLYLHGQSLAFEADVGTLNSTATYLLPTMHSLSSRFVILSKGFLLAAGGQLNLLTVTFPSFRLASVAFV